MFLNTHKATLVLFFPDNDRKQKVGNKKHHNSKDELLFQFDVLGGMALEYAFALEESPSSSCKGQYGTQRLQARVLLELYDI